MNHIESTFQRDDKLFFPVEILETSRFKHLGNHIDELFPKKRF
jgi:hypothetical protein